MTRSSPRERSRHKCQSLTGEQLPKQGIGCKSDGLGNGAEMYQFFSQLILLNKQDALQSHTGTSYSQ